MVIENIEVDWLRKKVAEIVSSHLAVGVYRLFFFGSRVDGTASERSDIDIGIEAENPIDGSIMTEIKDDLEKLPVLYKIEFVDFKTVSEKFKRVALKNIEIIKKYE